MNAPEVPQAEHDKREDDAGKQSRLRRPQHLTPQGADQPEQEERGAALQLVERRLGREAAAHVAPEDHVDVEHLAGLGVDEPGRPAAVVARVAIGFEAHVVVGHEGLKARCQELEIAVSTVVVEAVNIDEKRLLGVLIGWHGGFPRKHLPVL
jgi:hypothetical protein